MGPLNREKQESSKGLPALPSISSRFSTAGQAGNPPSEEVIPITAECAGKLLFWNGIVAFQGAVDRSGWPAGSGQSRFLSQESTLSAEIRITLGEKSPHPRHSPYPGSAGRPIP
jgi:hypothetical protein